MRGCSCLGLACCPPSSLSCCRWLPPHSVAPPAPCCCCCQCCWAGEARLVPGNASARPGRQPSPIIRSATSRMLWGSSRRAACCVQCARCGGGGCFKGRVEGKVRENLGENRIFEGEQTSVVFRLGFILCHRSTPLTCMLAELCTWWGGHVPPPPAAYPWEDSDSAGWCARDEYGCEFTADGPPPRPIPCTASACLCC